jgi:hypothetical protein
MRYYVRYKWARVSIHARGLTPGHFDFDDYFSIIVKGEKEKEDYERVVDYLNAHSDQTNYAYEITYVEYVETWWLVSKKHLLSLIDAIQLTYIYDLEQFLTVGNNKWEGLRFRSPRKKGKKY